MIEIKEAELKTAQIEPFNAASRGISAPTLMLPLRLFLGVAWLAAGLDKLLNPGFLNPGAASYIGNQLTGFARTSPLGDLLSAVAIPNAYLFGVLVLAGEIAIGLGTLFGLFSRTAAAFGLFLSLLLWVSASWQGQPFFLIPELPYAVAWLVLALTGSHPVWSLDGQIQKWWARRRIARMEEAGTVISPEVVEASAEIVRRRFLILVGATVATGVVTSLAWTNTVLNQSEAPQSFSNKNPPISQSSPAEGKVLTSLTALPAGTAQKFVTPDTGEKAILIHQADNQVFAYSTTCTHMGCDVVYDQYNHRLFCPCHEAQYDPQSGAPIAGPAPRPLKRFEVQLDRNGNIVYLEGAGLIGLG